MFLAVRQDVLPVRFDEFMAIAKGQTAPEVHPKRHSSEEEQRVSHVFNA
jgi:hypothetical protein